MKKYRILSLFSGAGGMDLGFINKGFEVVWANDFFPEAVETYRHNIGDHIILGDITKISCSEMPDDIDVLIGGFPCQGFSIANKNRGMHDERNFLYKEMLRIIKDKKPKVFIAENVKGLLSMEKGKVIKMIKNDFEEIGYTVDYKLLNAAEYGVPQARERVIIIGTLLNTHIIFPDTTHKIQGDLLNQDKPLAITVEEAIGWLSSIKTSDFPIIIENKIIYNHQATNNVHDKFWGRKYEVNQHDICDYLKIWRSKSGWSTKRIDEHFGYAHTAGHWFRKDNNSGSIPKPEDWWELKKILGFDDTYDKQVTTLVEKEIKFEQSLRITNWDRPSDTITATSPEIHINKKRRLSARECAIIQTFPNNFEFKGNLGKIYRQIGNAVPVKLAEKIAVNIRKMLDTQQLNK